MYEQRDAFLLRLFKGVFQIINGDSKMMRYENGHHVLCFWPLPGQKQNEEAYFNGIVS